MIRGIPPITSLNAQRKIAGFSRYSGIPPRAGKKEHKGEGFKQKIQRRPRRWVYETKPVFKKVREPLVDVFREAKEVKIIIDLGGFSRGEVNIEINPDKYIIFAKHQEQEFREEIDLPPDVDIEKTVENFRNGILEITLPKKKDKHKTARKSVKFFKRRISR